jgi:Flp pilus assembly protein TadD
MIVKKTYVALCLILLISCAGLKTSPDAELAFEQGLVLFNQGKYEQAIPNFQRAAEIESDYTKAYIYLGRSYLNINQWVDAIPPLRTAYRLSPAETKKEAVNLLLDALIGGALQELKKGNFKNSIGYLKEAIDVEPVSNKANNELVSALIAYGGSLMSEGDFSDAIVQFSEAVELAPANINAYRGLAEAFINNGNFFDAMKTINKAINIAPSEEERSLLRDLL